MHILVEVLLFAVQDREGRGAGAAGGGQHDGDGVGRGDGGDRPKVDRPVVVVLVDFFLKVDGPVRLRSRQQQASPRRDLLWAERSFGVRQHEQHCRGKSSQNFPNVFSFSEAFFLKHFIIFSPARAGTARWRTWRLIALRTVMSTSLGEGSRDFFR